MPVLVNGVEISDHAIHAELQYHPAGSVEEAREAAAQASEAVLGSFQSDQ